MEWEAKEKPTVTIHGSHGQAGPFDYSVMKKDGEGNCYFWTTEPPKEEGLFRAIDKDGFARWVQLRRAAFTDDHFLVSRIGYGLDVGLDNFTHWLGPLPVPEPPAEGE